MVHHTKRMRTPMSKTTNQQRSLEACLAAQADFDALLAYLQQMSGDHFGANPDAILWTATEELNRHNAAFRQVTGFRLFLLTNALAPGGLDPLPDRIGARFKLLRQVFGRAASSHKLNHPAAEFR